MQRFRHKECSSNSISDVATLVEEHLYSEDIEDHQPFFFNVCRDEHGKIQLGTGDDGDHFNVMMTSKSLLKKAEGRFQGKKPTKTFNDVQMFLQIVHLIISNLN